MGIIDEQAEKIKKLEKRISEYEFRWKKMSEEISRLKAMVNNNKRGEK